MVCRILKTVEDFITEEGSLIIYENEQQAGQQPQFRAGHREWHLQIPRETDASHSKQPLRNKSKVGIFFRQKRVRVFASLTLSLSMRNDVFEEVNASCEGKEWRTETWRQEWSECRATLDS